MIPAMTVLATMLHLGLLVTFLVALARTAPDVPTGRGALNRLALGLRELDRLTADQRERTELHLDSLAGRR